MTRTTLGARAAPPSEEDRPPGERPLSKRPAESSSQQRIAAPLEVSMLAPLPPWRAIGPYSRHLTEALENTDGLSLEVLDFQALYPPRLYPGGSPKDGQASPPRFGRVRWRRLLAWWNPMSWVWAGLTMRGRVLHAQWWSFVLAPVYVTVLAVARLRRRRVVLTLHNVQPHELKGWRRRLNASVLPFAHRFIVHSERNRQALIEAYPQTSSRVSVVPMGLHAVAHAGLTKAEARRLLGLRPEAPVILCFGNIRPYKGVDVLLRAFRTLLDGGQEAVLLIAGQPWGSFGPYDQLIDQLALRPRVRTWLEFVPEELVAQLFAASDLAVFPYTHFDAQSAAGTLALSFGLPIVVSDVGGLPELADPAAVVPPNDPDALAAAIRRLLDDPASRERLAAVARRKARELDWATIALRTAEVYRQA